MVTGMLGSEAARCEESPPQLTPYSSAATQATANVPLIACPELHRAARVKAGRNRHHCRPARPTLHSRRSRCRVRAIYRCAPRPTPPLADRERVLRRARQAVTAQGVGVFQKPGVFPNCERYLHRDIALGQGHKLSELRERGTLSLRLKRRRGRPMALAARDDRRLRPRHVFLLAASRRSQRGARSAQQREKGLHDASAHCIVVAVISVLLLSSAPRLSAAPVSSATSGKSRSSWPRSLVRSMSAAT